MKQKRMPVLVVLGALLAAGGAFADVELTGATEISSTQTISEKVTGSGYYIVTGGATLTLSNSENDFTGGIIVSNGVARINAAGAFGTGPPANFQRNRRRTFNADGYFLVNKAKGIIFP